MNKFGSKRSAIGFVLLVGAILLAMYIEALVKPSPGQGSLIDIQNIETLRAQFNRDEGYVRLILLASPT
jgi:hypothetical protein